MHTIGGARRLIFCGGSRFQIVIRVVSVRISRRILSRRSRSQNGGLGGSRTTDTKDNLADQGLVDFHGFCDIEAPFPRNRLGGLGMAKMTRLAFRYGVAVLAVATALALILIPHIGKGLISLLYLAVLVAAWYGGLGPGLLATVLIVVLAALSLTSEPDLAPWRIVSIVFFAGGGVVITLLVEALHAARRRVEASQQWLTAVLTSIGDAVITTDAQGRATFLNPVARTLTGWESEEAVGKSLAEIFQIVAEDTRVPVEDPVNRVLRENIVVGLANHTVLISRDGTERPIDDSGAPIKEKGGATTGVVLVFRDVTQRRQAEEIRARLAAIIETTDDAIVGKDLDGIVTSWNAGAERVFGYSSEEIVGRPIGLLIPTDRRDEEAEISAKLRRGERVDHFESKRITKDGRLIDVSLTISPIRDGHGRVTGASKIARDITDRKHLEHERRLRLEELAEANRRKDEFLAMLAHELRNPLAAISSAIQLPQSDRSTGHDRAVHGGGGPATQAPVAAGRRPVRRIADHPWEDPAPQGTARCGRGRP